MAGAADLVARAAAAERFKGKSGSALDLVAPPGLDVARLVVIGTGKASELKHRDFIKLGGIAMGKIPSAARRRRSLPNLPAAQLKPDQAADLALGVRLRAYSFDRYKTKRKEGEEAAAQSEVTIAVADAAAAQKA